MFEPPAFNIKQAQRLPGVLLWHASKLWQKYLNAALKDLGLSSTNAIILCNIWHLVVENELVTQAAVAKLSGVDIMTTSSAVRVLESKGYVSRQQAESDRRAQEVSLTAAGEAAAYQAMQCIAATHQAFFNALKEDDRRQFTQALQHLISNNN